MREGEGEREREQETETEREAERERERVKGRERQRLLLHEAVNKVQPYVHASMPIHAACLRQLVEMLFDSWNYNGARESR